jgi:hypothetical protein
MLAISNYSGHAIGSEATRSARRDSIIERKPSAVSSSLAAVARGEISDEALVRAISRGDRRAMQALRRRSPNLACRRAGPDRRSQDQRLGRAATLELAPRDPCRPRRLTVAAHAITIRRAAEILGEDEELLWDMAMDMEPEHGRLWIYDTNDQQTDEPPLRGLFNGNA